MKRSHLFLLGFIAILGFISCSKERPPSLIINVQEEDGTPAGGAIVHAWPGDDPQAGTGSGIANDSEYDQTLEADASGEVTFEFPNSAVLDVDVVYFKTTVDSSLNETIDTLRGSRIVKIEAVRQRSKENTYRETVEVK